MDRLMSLDFRKASATRAEHEEILADLNADFRSIMSNGGVSALKAETRFQMEAGALIRQAVSDIVSFTDPIPLMFESRTGTLGDTYEYEELVNTLRVVKYAPHSHPLTYTPLKDKYTITTRMYELTFGLPLLQIMTGQHEVGTYARFAAEAVQRHRLELGLTAIYTAVSGGATDSAGRALYDDEAGATVTEATLKSAIKRLGSASGGQIRIFGTKWALNPIYDFVGAVSEGLAEELNARGVMSVYRGCALVEIQHDYNRYLGTWTTVSGITLDDLLFLVADMPGGIFLERDISALDWEDLDVEKAQFRTGVRFDHGILVTQAWKYHVIEMNV